jgi:hypothetical protein
MNITIKKSGYQLVPEGEQILTVTSVKLLPSGRPSLVEFMYIADYGATLKEKLKFDHPVAVEILGKRCDVALGGTAEEGTEISPDDLEGLFLGKRFKAMIKHNQGSKGGTFANIKYLIELVEDEEAEENDDL